jgi:hypothetical protein
MLGATGDGDSSSESDSEASAVELEPRKRRCTKTRNYETVARSPFNTKYLVPALENTDPHSPDSIWNDASVLGRKFHLKGHLFGYGGITVVKGTEFLRFGLTIRHI